MHQDAVLRDILSSMSTQRGPVSLLLMFQNFVRNESYFVSFRNKAVKILQGYDSFADVDSC